jgi:chaperone required for assembly of F1-ATPase
VKRFYKTVSVEALETGVGFVVTLDGRQRKTPVRAVMAAPTRALAEAIAVEWQSQGDEIDPKAMPLNQLLNTAIDRVTSERVNIIDEMVRYAGSDMLCYRAGHPEDLVKRQADTWDPYLKWLDEQYQAPMQTTSGIIHVEQARDSLDNLRKQIETFDIFALTVLHALTTGLGSFGLGFAYVVGFQDFASIWDASRVDEDYQIEQWGEDSDAQKVTEKLKRDLETAVRFFELIAA